MRECCDQNSESEMLRERQSGTLKIVLAVNVAMFLVIVAAGLYASSPALLSDSLDDFGDALTYALKPLRGAPGCPHESARRLL